MRIELYEDNLPRPHSQQGTEAAYSALSSLGFLLSSLVRHPPPKKSELLPPAKERIKNHRIPYQSDALAEESDDKPIRFRVFPPQPQFRRRVLEIYSILNDDRNHTNIHKET